MQSSIPLSLSLFLFIYLPSNENRLRSLAGSNQTDTALQIKNFISIRWGYLAFLAIQVVLLGVIIESTRLKIEVVKGSALAALFAINAEDKALLEETEEDADSINSNSMNSWAAMAKRVSVKLVQGERGWRFGLMGRGGDAHSCF